MRVLIVAPYYAPFSEVSAVRMISLSRQLIACGHQVSVFSFSKEMLATLTDERNLKSIVPQGVNQITFELKKSSLPAFSDIIHGIRFKRVFFSKVNPKEYDVVLLSCGPFYTLQIVPKLKKMGVLNAVDFRDLGAIAIRPKRENVSNATSFIAKTLKKVYKHLVFKREKKAVICSNLLIAVSSIDKKMICDSYKLDLNKVVIATNGYDEEILDSIPLNKNKRDKSIVIGIFGKFMYYSIEKSLFFLKAVCSLRKNGINISVLHIGQPYEWISKEIDLNGIDKECYECVGIKEYLDGMKELSQVDLFAVEDTSPDDVGTKIYDYIFLNKPVIAIANPEIPLSKLVRTFENGFVCETEEQILNALKHIIENNISELDSNINRLLFSRKYQNGILIEALEKQVDSSKK